MSVTTLDGRRAPQKAAVLSPTPIRRSRTDEVGQQLRQAIVEGRLRPGSLHSVQELATQVGTSRTPVREALIQLARGGMVSFVRNRGVRILELTPRDLTEIFELRRWIEGPCARAAAVMATTPQKEALLREFDQMKAAARRGDIIEMWRHDKAFHRKIVEASGNARAADYVDNLRDLVLARRVIRPRARSHVEEAEGHRPILDALLAGDGDAAAHAVLEHLRESELIFTGKDPPTAAVGQRATRA